MSAELPGRLLLCSCFYKEMKHPSWSACASVYLSFCPHNFWPCQSSWWIQRSSGCPESTVLLKRGWGVEESQAVSVPLILCWKHMSKREVSCKCSNQAFSLAYASLGIATCQGSQLREPNPQECVNMSIATTAALPRISRMSTQLLALEEIIKSEMQLVTAVGMIGEWENHTAHLSSLPLRLCQAVDQVFLLLRSSCVWSRANLVIF